MPIETAIEEGDIYMQGAAEYSVFMVDVTRAGTYIYVVADGLDYTLGNARAYGSSVFKDKFKKDEHGRNTNRFN